MLLLKRVPILLITIFLSFSATAQFFGSVPKPKGLASLQSLIARPLTAADIADAPTIITVKNEFRPIVNILSTGYQINHRGTDTDPGVVALYGAGVAYQHLIWNATTEKWNIQWSINALTWLSTRISGKEMSKDWYGVVFGLWDSKIMFGTATDLIDWLLTLGIGIPLNNL